MRQLDWAHARFVSPSGPQTGGDRLERRLVDAIGGIAKVKCLQLIDFDDGDDIVRSIASELNSSGGVEELSCCGPRGGRVARSVLALMPDIASVTVTGRFPRNVSGMMLIARQSRDRGAHDFLGPIHTPEAGAIAPDHRYLDTIAAGEGMKLHSSLRKIRVDASMLDDRDTPAVRYLLRPTPLGLRVLDLRGDGRADSDLSPIFAALRVPGCPLETLRLCHYRVSTREATALREALKANRTLKKVALVVCLISTPGWHMISDALRYNLGLEALVLTGSGNVMDDHGTVEFSCDALIMLFSGLCANDTLRRLVLDKRTHWPLSGLHAVAIPCRDAFETCMLQNRGLEQIDGPVFRAGQSAIKAINSRRANRSLSVRVRLTMPEQHHIREALTASNCLQVAKVYVNMARRSTGANSVEEDASALLSGIAENRQLNAVE